ncbi:MAG: DUF4112 domain-containing protein [Planctomycetaceae bacterium]|nr:DUF4112 domain-containing protein [Planctomycetaceae bacterium]
MAASTVLQGEVVSTMSDAERIKRFRRVQRLAKLLDGQFKIPVIGTSIGLDGLVGLIPVGGDVVTAGMSAWIIHEAWKIGIPKGMLLRMIGNSVGDLFVGSVPVAGDLFDFFWKANKKNVELLERHLRSEGVVVD